MNRDDLPDEADNHDVWCERCQKVHRYFTFTKEDFDLVVREGAQKLADAIDAQAVSEAMKTFAGVAELEDAPASDADGPQRP